MIRLFFIVYDYSGALTYARQLLPQLRRNPELAVYEVYIRQEIPEPTLDDLSAESASGEGLRLFFPDYRRRAERKPVSPAGDGPGPELERLKTYIRPGDPVVFHCNSEIHYSLAHQAKTWLGAAVVTTLHYLPTDYTWYTLKRSAVHKNRIKGDVILPRKLTDLSDRVICVTRFAAQALERIDGTDPGKLAVVHNGYDDGRERSAPDPELRKRLGLPEGPLVLFVGSVQRSKGVHYLIDAVRELLRKGHALTLVIVGEECRQGKERFRKRIGPTERHFRFTGTLPPEKVTDYYRAADLGVVPSQAEQGGYVTLEMMKHGLPLIVTDIPGLDEIAEDGGGLAVPCKAVRHWRQGRIIRPLRHRLAAAIAPLLDDPAGRRRLADRGRARWETEFTSRLMAERTLEVYASALDEAPPPENRMQKPATALNQPILFNC